MSLLPFPQKKIFGALFSHLLNPVQDSTNAIGMCVYACENIKITFKRKTIEEEGIHSTKGKQEQ